MIWDGETDCAKRGNSQIVMHSFQTNHSFEPILFNDSFEPIRKAIGLCDS